MNLNKEVLLLRWRNVHFLFARMPFIRDGFLTFRFSFKEKFSYEEIYFSNEYEGACFNLSYLRIHYFFSERNFNVDNLSSVTDYL